MTYKTKSLIYFFCFVFAATAYHVLEQYEAYKQQFPSQELAETSYAEDSDYGKTSKEDLAKLSE
ncbi:hypothetical protein [Flagellimonas allohymeniacidonis]|uniref:Uncharacterized protein n=1 Tax=Flagellimonas allohymeniacidonis TaxID=2517819 RepID=A0A4Q8QCS1_9FLAO|nr:hypothetical protein [Allomuricauda hymeniacidonis]TAI48141.1 hypothetical protein EW142_15975 [Allomuricauda hymeniacidonis]